ncbi:MAG: YafY family transcriptional regulator [Caldilineaceae bacterium]|nr:YafY family transcriptional regulator [Caldilineaceae bacterium]
MNRIDRLLGYLLVFQSQRHVRAQDLAARFEVSDRTVYRDIDALCEVGVPIVGMPGTGYELLEGYHLPPVMFSEAEARALFLAISMLTGLTQAGETRQAAATALEKVRAVLPEPTLAQVEAMQAVLGFYTVARTPLDLDDVTFERLQTAIHERRVVNIHYHAGHSNRISARDVEPLHLAYVDRAWILGAYCRLRQDQRNFRLDRIDQLTLLDETFEPRELTLGRSTEEGQRVVAHFDGSIARWVQETPHFSFVSEIDENEDGGLTLEFRVASMPQFVRWLLSWGEQMQVLEPEGLRDELRRIAQALATNSSAEIGVSGDHLEATRFSMATPHLSATQGDGMPAAHVHLACGR